MKRDHILPKLGSNSSSEIPQVIWMNAAAPSLIPADHQLQASKVMTWALSDQMQSIGLCLMPSWTYTKGRLHLEEKAILERLAHGNHNLDWTFSVVFGSKCDQRDMRPMVYAGRFCFASPLELTQNVFWSSELRKKQRTDEVQQLHSRDMREIENLDEEALPTSTDSRENIRGAAKFAQIGASACEAVLNGVLTGAQYETIGTGLLLIDLHVLTGDMLEAFIAVRKNYPHTFCIGFCEDQNQVSFIERIMKERLVEAFINGAPMPNGEKVETKMTEDLIDPLPEVPRLNVLALWSDLLNYGLLICHLFVSTIQSTG